MVVSDSPERFRDDRIRTGFRGSTLRRFGRFTELMYAEDRVRNVLGHMNLCPPSLCHHARLCLGRSF